MMIILKPLIQYKPFSQEDYQEFGRAYYTPKDHTITLSPRAWRKSDLIHELIHATGHWLRPQLFYMRLCEEIIAKLATKYFDDPPKTLKNDGHFGPIILEAIAYIKANWGDLLQEPPP